MALPPPGERTPAPKKGKSKSRRYAMSWVYREDPSNDDTELNLNEVRSTNIQSAVTALLKVLNDGVERDDPEFLRKSHLVVVEARVMGRSEKLFEDPEEE